VGLSVSFVTPPAAFAQPAQPGQSEPPKGPLDPLAGLPPEPEVNDPMLAPVARAATEVGTWQQALRLVRDRSTDLRIAAQQIVRAEAASRITLASLLTTINGSLQYTHNLITNDSLQPVSANPPVFKTVSSPPPDFLNGSILAVQPLFAPRAWHALGTADRNEQIAHLGLEDAKRLVAVGVANAIVGVVTAERVAELNRLGLKNSLTRLELTRRKTSLGSGTGLDVVRARQDVEAARATLVAGDETLRQARETLGLALGIPNQVGVPPTVDMNGIEVSARSSCTPAPTVDARADIAALHGQVEVAHRNIDDVKYQFSPTIDLRSALTTTTNDTGATPATQWNIGAVLTVPIWDGGIKYGNLRDAKAQEAIAGEKLEAAKRQATVDVLQAQRSVAVADDRRRVATATRDLAAENDRLTRTSYLEGRGTSLELVTAAQALREAEIQLALREFDLVKARIAAILVLATCPW
jgi:outer membrane protein TolC